MTASDNTKDFHTSSVLYDGYYGIIGYETICLNTRLEVLYPSLSYSFSDEDVPMIEGRKYKPCLILLLDVSYSMLEFDNLEKVKACVLHLHKVLTSKYAPLSLSEIMDLHIITFSAEAKLVWSTQFCPDSSFFDVVSDLKVDGSTNIWHAVKLAKQLMLRKTPTWMVLLTDGKATTNDFKDETVSNYTQLFKSLPPYVDTIGVGVGDDYDDSILLTMNSMLHGSSTIDLQNVLSRLHVDR